MRYLTAGESHGKGLIAILEGMPAGLKIDLAQVNHELKRRQGGYGRGGRMKIETDMLEVYSGMRGGITLGSPISFVIPNADYKNWESVMDSQNGDLTKKQLTCVRPGHADLSGCIKYGFKDARNILERASARETAARVGVGAFCKQLLNSCGITIGSYVSEIAGVRDNSDVPSAVGLNQKSDTSCVRCLDSSAEKKMIKAIDSCIKNGDTAGGEIVLVASGVPVGVGSHVQFDRRLDFILSGHLAGIQAVKSVSFGLGVQVASLLGSKMHDEITLDSSKKNAQQYVRKTNNAGGVEGGISNGQDIVIRLSIKPIPTLMKGLKTVDILTNLPATAAAERSDTTAVAAAGVVAEAVLAFALCDAISAVTGGDTAQEFFDRVTQLRAKTI